MVRVNNISESRWLVQIGILTECSTFVAFGESREGKPFTAVMSGRFYNRQFGWQHGLNARPLFYKGWAFLF